MAFLGDSHDLAGSEGKGCLGRLTPGRGWRKWGRAAFPPAAVPPGDTPLQLIRAAGPPVPAADQLTAGSASCCWPIGSGRPTSPACDSGQAQWDGDAMGWGWVFWGELRGWSKRLEGGRRELSEEDTGVGAGGGRGGERDGKRKEEMMGCQEPQG